MQQQIEVRLTEISELEPVFSLYFDASEWPTAQGFVVDGELHIPFQEIETGEMPAGSMDHMTP